MIITAFNYNSKILERVQDCTTYGNPYNKLFLLGLKFQIIDKIGKCAQFNFNDKMVGFINTILVNL